MTGTTTAPAATSPEAERLHVDHAVAKRLGRWTGASRFDARVRYRVLVLDLRSPDVQGDVEVLLRSQDTAVAQGKCSGSFHTAWMPRSCTWVSVNK